MMRILFLTLALAVTVSGCAQGIHSLHGHGGLLHALRNKASCQACNETYIEVPPFYGYYPACWQSWPEGWLGCPAPHAGPLHAEPGGEPIEAGEAAEIPLPLLPSGDPAGDPDPDPFTPPGIPPATNDDPASPGRGSPSDLPPVPPPASDNRPSAPAPSELPREDPPGLELPAPGIEARPRSPDGDTPDGDTPDGDTPDGDTPDLDTPDLDTPDGEGGAEARDAGEPELQGGESSAAERKRAIFGLVRLQVAPRIELDPPPPPPPAEETAAE